MCPWINTIYPLLQCQSSSGSVGRIQKTQVRILAGSQCLFSPHWLMLFISLCWLLSIRDGSLSANLVQTSLDLHPWPPAEELWLAVPHNTLPLPPVLSLWSTLLSTYANRLLSAVSNVLETDSGMSSLTPMTRQPQVSTSIHSGFPSSIKSTCRGWPAWALRVCKIDGSSLGSSIPSCSLDWVLLCLSPLRSGWSLRLSANLPYMAYFAAVVTPGGPEWALGRLVVLLSTPVTIIRDLTLNFAHIFLQLRFRCTSCTLQLTNVFCCSLQSQNQLQSFLKVQLCFRQ